MQEVTVATGMILKAEPIGEYDRRVVLLTMEYGKITAFARGARRPNSKLLASTSPFCYGHFNVYPGRNAYTLVDAEITHYFDELRNDFEAAFFGMYFLEIADYYGRENNDEVELLKLLYVSCLALTKDVFPNLLVRYVYEIKSIIVNGEFPGIPENMHLLQDTLYALDHIVGSSATKLFSFQVSDQVLDELGRLAAIYRKRCFDRKFKSLEILESLTVS